jgi:transcriptional regulator with PAS, ATPase and Fis domain
MSEANNPILPSSMTAGAYNRKTTGPEVSKIIYRSETMNRLMKLVERVSPSQATVLILGESGTGKELIARAVHERSPRKFKPFVAINCGALRETLLESELFGHEKGAFTGAYTRKIGLAEVATGGTLFLDEIGELSPGIQAKLLRFIQEGEIFRVGGKEPIKVDIRLVSATNKDLEVEVSKGRFREDLFYRVNTITAQMPTLRQRKEDIPLLVEYFLSAGHGNPVVRSTVSDEAMQLLMKYDWPGNIRELQNICERIQILAEGHMIMPGDLPENIRSPDMKMMMDDYDPTMTIHELERRYILKALSHFKGNKTQAANALGITIKTLYNKLHEYGEFENFAIHSKVKI